MRTTIAINEALYQKALEWADPKLDKADLFREAVSNFVSVQAGKCLAALGELTPEMPDVPRRHATGQRLHHARNSSVGVG